MTSARPRWGLIAGLLLLWGYTISHYLHAVVGYQGYGDFYVLIGMVRQWLATGQYASGGAQYAYMHSPLFYLINVPLAMLSDQVSGRVMWAINQGLFAVSIGLLLAMVPRSHRRVWAAIILPVALNFRPLLLLLSMANIEMLQVTLLVGALLAFQRGKPWVTGSLAAVSGMLKPLPMLFILYFCWKRQWPVVRAWGVVMVAILSLCSVFVGIDGVWAYFHMLIQGTPIYWYEDQSLATVAMRLFHRPVPNKFFLDPAEVAPASMVLGWALRLAVLGWIGWCLRPRHTDSLERTAGEWSIVLAAILLVSPYARDYYAAFLAPAYVFLAYRLWQQRAWRSLAGWWGVGSYVLVGQGFPLGVIRRMPQLLPGVDNFHTYLHYGIPTIGYLLLIAAWAQLLSEAHATSSPQSV